MKLGYHSSKQGETLGFPLSKREWILYIELKESFSVQMGFNVYASAFKGPADLVKSKYIAKLVQVVQQGTDSRYLTKDTKPMLPALITQVAEKKGQDRALWRLEKHLAAFLPLQGEGAVSLRWSDPLSQCHGAFFSSGDQGRKDHSTQALHGGHSAFLYGNCWCGRYSGGCRAEGPGYAPYLGLV